MNIENNNQPTNKSPSPQNTNGAVGLPPSLEKAQVSQKGQVKTFSPKTNKKINKKIIFALIGLVIFILGTGAAIFITQIQREKPEEITAPTAPKSEPSADVVGDCSLVFYVQPESSPTPTPTSTVTPTPTDTLTPTPTGTLTPTPTGTLTPTPTGTLTPTPTGTLSPTPTGTLTPSPTDEPGATSTPTTPPTNTPTTPVGATYTPSPTGVVVVTTTTDCNDVCTVNADCDNISHICYNGRCRLDVNPEDENCQLPSGETVVERLPREPEELAESGFKEWGSFLKAGIGALAAGLLLILVL